MKTIVRIAFVAIGAVLCATAPAAVAKDIALPLSEANAAALRGKTAAVVLHAPPTFLSMTTGKSTFGLLGVAAMAASGNQLVKDNGIADPAILVREQLGTLITDRYGLRFLPVDTDATTEKKPARLAKLHPEADYVFSVRSASWHYNYYTTQWDEYWLAYSVQVQLIDTRSGALVSNLACNANTHANPVRPKKAQLEADGARLTKDITTMMGWVCVQILAAQQWNVPAADLPAIPERFLNPQARLLAGAQAPAAPAGAVSGEAATGDAERGGSAPSSEASPPAPVIDQAPAADAPAAGTPAASMPSAGMRSAQNAGAVTP